jgi:hypothetical protein
MKKKWLVFVDTLRFLVYKSQKMERVEFEQLPSGIILSRTHKFIPEEGAVR